MDAKLALARNSLADIFSRLFFACVAANDMK
jgi:hypothetical protein